MDSHALEYYSPYSDESSTGRFHQVFALHDEPDLDWLVVSEMSPNLCRGWYELAQLLGQDRIDFTHEYWLSKLPYNPNLNQFLNSFFSSLDEIGIFLTQKSYDDPFEPHLVYSMAENGGFFHGGTPTKDTEIIALQKVFPDYILPVDYLAFLQIHNGFAKWTDTGILKISEMEETYKTFQSMLGEKEPLMNAQGAPVNPKSLIPFYKSFGMPFFQCFWGEWYPENEMGTVYYSGVNHTISDCTKTDFHVETMAFETFTEWLMFYLEKID